METWCIIIFSLCIAALIGTLFNLLFSSNNLPPGPFKIPIITNILLNRKSLLELENLVRSLIPKYGPILTLHINSKPTIYISDRTLAYQALIQTGAIFADRPPSPTTRRIIFNNQSTISSAHYGPTWRLFRRNLMAEILHPSRIKLYSNARKRVLQSLLDFFNSKSNSGDTVRLIDHFESSMRFLLVLMCFGDKVDMKKIKEVEDVQRFVLMNVTRFEMLDLWPRITKILFRKQYEEFLRMQQRRNEVIKPLLAERRKIKEEERLRKTEHEYVRAYVDTLFDLELPEEKRKLDEDEIMSFCSEFLNAGSITTSATLEWLMANLVKYPHIQEKLFTEIKGIVGESEREVKEEDLTKMPYLKAVILETLRRYPPVRFVVPHAVTEDVILNGFLVPKNASVNFMVADIGWDSKVWEDPMEFKPERFLNKEVFDITGTKEIKMMPFGVGRRICPGLGLGMLHLEYFVANIIWQYELKAVEGDEVNMEGKQDLVLVMKYPLQVHLNPRFP